MKTPTAIVPVEQNGRLKFEKVQLVVAYTGSPLAITMSTHLKGWMTITHLPTGRRVSVLHDDQGELTQLLERLVELPWPQSEAAIKGNKELTAAASAIIKDWKATFQGGKP